MMLIHINCSFNFRGSVNVYFKDGHGRTGRGAGGGGYINHSRRNAGGFFGGGGGGL